MAIIKCKMCGGDMEINEEKSFGVCEYCGSTMTLPKIDDEQRLAAFNRGNYFRRIGEFDKAISIFEQIVAEDDTDAEAHWCCALCRFGIEYVEDPATLEWLPTCHRVSFDSFLEDVDYLAAVKYSDGITRRQYQKDAAKIAEVQRGVLATSQKEEPFDVFICYKESDENGQRTVDSTLAQDIYYQLTEKGRRVFFARITLEDKGGAEYEPYIFAALNSSKVMVVVGTKTENFNAVWVKNEWSRFLSLMKKDHSKLLLPCYRDMNPYDLPDQLSVLQSYDMSKIGFIQDLIRGVDKVLDAGKQTETKKETVVIQGEGGGNVSALIKRGNMSLEDGDWDKAQEFFDRVLDNDAECAEAYLGKALADMNLTSLDAFEYRYLPKADNIEPTELQAYVPNQKEREEKLAEENEVSYYLTKEDIHNICTFDFSYPSRVSRYKKEMNATLEKFRNRNFKRAEEYASGKLKMQIEAFKSDINNKMKKALKALEDEDTQSQKNICERYDEAFAKWEEQATQMRTTAEAKREDVYQRAVSAFEKEEDNDKALNLFQREVIIDYKDSKEYIEKIKKREKEKAEQARLQAEKEKEEALLQKEKKRKKKIKRIKISISCTVVIIVFAVVLFTVIIPSIKYNTAMNYYQDGDYVAAYTTFDELGDFSDAKDMADKILQDVNGDAMEEYSKASEGDIIEFGDYSWIVLEKTDDTMLIITEDIIEERAYNEEYEGTTWEDCTLRKYLNGTFYNSFSEEEQLMIAETAVTNPDNSKYGTDGGNDTTDKIFLLSLEEAEEYMTEDERTASSWWWLRSPGNNQLYAAGV